MTVRSIFSVAGAAATKASVSFKLTKDSTCCCCCCCCCCELSKDNGRSVVRRCRPYPTPIQAAMRGNSRLLQLPPHMYADAAVAIISPTKSWMMVPQGDTNIVQIGGILAVSILVDEWSTGFRLCDMIIQPVRDKGIHFALRVSTICAPPKVQR
jgi:hypothetical protein